MHCQLKYLFDKTLLQKGTAADPIQTDWWGAALESTLQLMASLTSESGARTRCVFAACDPAFKWLQTEWPCSGSWRWWMLLFCRCMAEGACSIPLELDMREKSKATCTTAQEHTPSLMVLCIRVIFMRIGILFSSKWLHSVLKLDDA